MKRSPSFYALVVILGLFVIAAVVVRIDGAESDEEVSLLGRLSLGVMFTVGTVGPAVAGDLLLRKLIPASRAAREYKRSKKALSEALAKKRKAERRINAIHDEHGLHRHWVVRIRGRYYRYFDPARTRAGHTGPTIQSADPNS